MGCFQSKRESSQSPPSIDPLRLASPRTPVKKDPTSNPRIHRVPQYSKNSWGALNNGPSKRDGIAQRKRDQLALEKLVREAKFGPDVPLCDASVKPKSLPSRSLSGIVEYILSGQAKKIVVLAGAGISTSAGIPDFRTPGTGLYDNLTRLNLPFPEAVFDLDFFRKNPCPFYVLAKEIYPGPAFRPTVSHAFLALLYRKELLSVLFTQNIDTLERQVGIPGDLIVEAHGSFATQSCIECKSAYPGGELMKKAIESEEAPHCLQPDCSGLVKPDIIFFGEQLPSLFHERCQEIAASNLVIIMGTSLSVPPFSELPDLASEGTPRILFNNERVGSLGKRPDDVLLLGDCDGKVRELAEALGWTDELEKLWLGVHE